MSDFDEGRQDDGMPTGACPECHHPRGSRHHDACSGAHRDDFVGVPRSPGATGVVHLFVGVSDITSCCGRREASLPHRDGMTLDPQWATCPQLSEGATP